MSKFDTVMANLRESLAHATPDEDGQPSYCMVRKDELEALIVCANAIRATPFRALHFTRSLRKLEACADE